MQSLLRSQRPGECHPPSYLWSASGRYFKSGAAHSMVCAHGGRAQVAVWLCTDLTELNKSVEKERLPLVENTTGQLTGSEVFSKLDANSGFWQIPFSKENSLLTTFIVSVLLEPSMFCHLICARTLPETHPADPRVSRWCCVPHGWRAHQESQSSRAWQEAAENIQIEWQVWVLNRTIKFLGQNIGVAGVSTDPNKVSTVKTMKEPRNVSEVRCFLGMTNHLGKFMPHLTEKTHTLRELTKKSNMWVCGPQQPHKGGPDYFSRSCSVWSNRWHACLCRFLIIWDGNCSPPVKWSDQTNKHRVRGCDRALWFYVCLSQHTRSGAHGQRSSVCIWTIQEVHTGLEL